MHLVGVIDRPHMDVEITGMCPVDEPPVDERDTGGGDRNLHTVPARMTPAQPETRGPQLGDTLRAE